MVLNGKKKKHSVFECEKKERKKCSIKRLAYFFFSFALSLRKERGGNAMCASQKRERESRSYIFAFLFSLIFFLCCSVSNGVFRVRLHHPSVGRSVRLSTRASPPPHPIIKAREVKKGVCKTHFHFIFCLEKKRNFK